MNEFKNSPVYRNDVEATLNECAVSYTLLIWKLPKKEESNTEFAVTINYSVRAKITENIFSYWNAWCWYI
jgi:hypothetical protein